MILHANLDCEARWAGVALPQHVLRRISAAGALIAAFAPSDGDAPEVWTPAAVAPERLVGIRAALRVGVPARADLSWAQLAAKPHNDRRFALALARTLGIALPAARAIGSLAELDAHLAGQPAERWVCKAAWTAAGRDRYVGEGDAIAGEARAYVERLLARPGGVVFEPWLDRIVDVGQCAEVSATGATTLLPPHLLRSDVRGGFTGIELGDPPLETAERDQLAEVALAAGAALARAGYAGPFTIDAFAYRDAGERRFHALCELNARLTFGRVARALGGHALGFGPPPPGARVVIAPAADDAFTAWSAA